MRSFGLVHILLILVAVLAYQCANAQDYAITTKGDTVRGNLKMFTLGPDKKVVIADEDKKKTSIHIFQVKRFSYEDEIYQPVKGPYGYTFMKLLKPGYLSLYAYQLENQVTYDGLYMTKKDGTGVDVPNLSFKKTMKKFLSECPEIATKLDNGDYSRKDLHTMIDDFNNCIDRKSIRHKNVIAQAKTQIKKLDRWDSLEEKVNALKDFEGKTDALEMINEIRNKISRAEKIPNFMVEGLKESLRATPLQADLDSALTELK